MEDGEETQGQAMDHASPGFLEGAEVARARHITQPGFEDQLSLLEGGPDLRRKLSIALLVIFAVFFGGMLAGAVLGIFV